jgi:hypothetical protein
VSIAHTLALSLVRERESEKAGRSECEEVVKGGIFY